MNIQITSLSRCLRCSGGATEQEGGRGEIMSEEEVSDGGGRGRGADNRAARGIKVSRGKRVGE